MKSTLQIVLLLTALAMAGTAWSADVSGTWRITIESQTGTSNSTLGLTQTGEVITGSYSGQFGDAPVTGTLKDTDLLLSFRAEMQGVPLEITYTASVTGNAMNGKVLVVGFGEGTLKGVRQ